MIVHKVWERYRYGVDVGRSTKQHCQDVYTGWFLFGILPLFITRERTRL